MKIQIVSEDLMSRAGYQKAMEGVYYQKTYGTVIMFDGDGKAWRLEPEEPEQDDFDIEKDIMAVVDK